MFAKGRRPQRATDEPSVVERPEARLFLGSSNAAFGSACAFVVLAPVVNGALTYKIAAVLSLLAFATSVYLGIQLVRQHLSCSRCWTAHVVNAILCPLLIAAAIAR